MEQRAKIPPAKRIQVRTLKLTVKEKPTVATIITMYREPISSAFYKVGEAVLTPESVYNLNRMLQNIITKHAAVFEKYKKSEKGTRGRGKREK